MVSNGVENQNGISVTKIPQTAGYLTPFRWSAYAPGIVDAYRYPFNSGYVDLMLRDPQIFLGLSILDAPLYSAKVTPIGPDAALNQFMGEQFKRIWSAHASDLLLDKCYGYIAAEVMYRYQGGKVEFDRLETRHPRDCRALVGDENGQVAESKRNPQEGKLVGAEFRNIRSNVRPAIARLKFPRCLWLNYDPRYGNHYGWPLLDHAFVPWYDKASEGGALALRRLRMIKDAWTGDVIYYDDGWSTKDTAGNVVTGAMVAREIIENRAAGGVMALPMAFDAQGNPRKILEYIPPTQCVGTNCIDEWLQQLDWGIFDGIGLAKEIVEAAASGSGYSGRSIPYRPFLGGRDREFGAKVRQIKAQILDCLAWANFGHDDYDLVPVSMLEEFDEQEKQGQQKQQSNDASPYTVEGQSRSVPEEQAGGEQKRLTATQMSIADEPGTENTQAEQVVAAALESADAIHREVGQRLSKLLDRKKKMR